MNAAPTRPIRPYEPYLPEVLRAKYYDTQPFTIPDSDFVRDCVATVEGEKCTVWAYCHSGCIYYLDMFRRNSDQLPDVRSPSITLTDQRSLDNLSHMPGFQISLTANQKHLVLLPACKKGVILIKLSTIGTLHLGIRPLSSEHSIIESLAQCAYSRNMLDEQPVVLQTRATDKQSHKMVKAVTLLFPETENHVTKLVTQKIAKSTAFWPGQVMVCSQNSTHLFDNSLEHVSTSLNESKDTAGQEDSTRMSCFAAVFEETGATVEGVVAVDWPEHPFRRRTTVTIHGMGVWTWFDPAHRFMHSSQNARLLACAAYITDHVVVLNIIDQRRTLELFKIYPVRKFVERIENSVLKCTEFGSKCDTISLVQGPATSMLAITTNGGICWLDFYLTYV